MRSVNKVFLIGCVGGDAREAKTGTGMSVFNFSLATNKKTKDKEKTNWHQCVCFDKIADSVGKFIKKGAYLHIEGEIDYSEYEKDGERKFSTKILCSNITVLKFVNEVESGSDEKSADYEKAKNEFTGDELPF